MNFQAVYQRLMERARHRAPPSISERHHIVPKCLGGSNDPANLVNLTPEEHYVAHQILVKLYPGNGKLIFAAIAMTEGGRSSMRRGNKLYGWLRRRFVERQMGRPYSEATKRKIGDSSRARNQGEAHPMFGRTQSPATRAKISAANKGRPSARRGTVVSDESKARMRAARKRFFDAGGTAAFKGCRHTEATREKMRAAKRGNPL